MDFQAIYRKHPLELKNMLDDQGCPAVDLAVFGPCGNPGQAQIQSKNIKTEKERSIYFRSRSNPKTYFRSYRIFS